MRIDNIANNKGDKTYELTIIGKESELQKFAEFTKYTADFIEEELNDGFSMTIMSAWEWNKKEFRAQVTAELKEFRKISNQ